MPADLEAQDAYIAVEVPLPNGKIARGRSIPWRTALKLIALSDAFARGGEPKKTLFPLLAEFEKLTGIDEPYLLGLCPDLSLGEVIEMVNRFFYSRRTATPNAKNGTPTPATGA